MKISIVEGSENYACQVIKLPPKQKVDGLDNLVKITYQGNDILTRKDADENQLYLFFPVECSISKDYLSYNNEFRHTNLNNNPQEKPGFFEDSCRVKSIKFKGVISTGYIAPIDTLLLWFDTLSLEDFKIGMEFTDIDDVNICKKYKVTRIQSDGTKESRYNKKLKRFDKLVPNQFRFHVSTPPLAKNLHVLNPNDIIVISSKWHGTSAVFSNLLINKKLDWKHRVAKFLGIQVVDKEYGEVYSSRSVIKNL